MTAEGFLQLSYTGRERKSRGGWGVIKVPPPALFTLGAD
jgi:hypothetical protein